MSDTSQHIAEFTENWLHNFPGVISPKRLAWSWDVSVESVTAALDLLVKARKLEKHGPAYTKPI